MKKYLVPFVRGRLLANISPSDIRAYTAKRQADVIIMRKARVVEGGDGRREEIPAVTKLVSNGEINRRADGPEADVQSRGFTKAWQSACRSAGCPGRIPHDLRRTAVRTLVRAGVRERVAMQLTGHRTRSVFERYNIVSDGDLRHAAARLDLARDHKSDHTFPAAGRSADPARQIS